ncbi:5'-nucleotidase [anaerobic digester metagenome]
MFTHLFFDLDGTLIDSKPGIFKSVLHTLEVMGVPPPLHEEELNPFIGPPLRQSFKTLFGFSDHKAEEATVIYREFYGREGMNLFTMYPGIPGTLETLVSMGLSVSLVTSKAGIYALKIVEEAGLTRYFETVSGCEINGNRSDKAELITYTLQKHGISPGKEIVMIGDRYHDIRGAKQTGISSAGVLYGYGSRREIEAEKPDLIIPSPAEIVNLLTGNAGWC